MYIHFVRHSRRSRYVATLPFTRCSRVQLVVTGTSGVVHDRDLSQNAGGPDGIWWQVVLRKGD